MTDIFQALKTLIGQPEFADMGDEEILAAINTQDQISPEVLTKPELIIFFSKHPIVEARLKTIARNDPDLQDPNSVAIWGLATSALRLVNVPGLDYSLFENIAPALQILLQIDVLDQQQYADLLALSTKPISRAEQVLSRFAESADLSFARLLPAV